MNIINLIQKKQNGKELSKSEIYWLVKEYTADNIPDYQMAAFLMAVYFSKLNENEVSYLTEAMANSGDVLDLSRFKNLSADKHSTGGVGDKTSLITACVAAACGCVVCKMSGKGLGHTGGTVDKLMSIPGMRMEFDTKEFIAIAEKTGLIIASQSGNITPADKKIYALRDATSTVQNEGLIVSSIMSKKIAAGCKNIVLDVKCGSGAFFKTQQEAQSAALSMIEVGKKANRNIRAVISDMDTPLGNAIGNSLEVIEALEVLKGRGPDDLREISLVLAAHMVSLAFDIDFDKAYEKAQKALESNKALEKFTEMIRQMGGNAEIINDYSLFKKAKFEHKVVLKKGGYVLKIQSETIGNASVLLGAGRLKKNDPIDYGAGIKLFKKTGDEVKASDVIAVLYTDNESVINEAEKMINEAVSIGDPKPEKTPLIYKTL